MVVMAAWAIPAWAQTGEEYSLSQVTFSGGGGVSTSVEGDHLFTIIGEHTAGQASGDGYTMVVGSLPGLIDAGPSCPAVSPPLAGGVTKNRYLSFAPSNPAAQTAIRVTFANLPAPYDGWNGVTMWVGAPREVTELSGLAGTTPEPTAMMATLQCEELHMDWSTVGLLHVYHEGIVPDATYEAAVVDEGCPLSYSDSLLLTTSKWGDVCGPLVGGQWSAPNGVVDITSDIISLITKFSNHPSAPIKARSDIEPALPDQVINITDVVYGLDAFRGLPYPFPPGPPPCGG